jgi:hypothetical protein
MKIIFYVAISDFLANFAYMLPLRPNKPNPWCWLQSFFNLTCYPMSWLWTLTLVYLLYKLAKGQSLPSNLRYYHIFNWGFPLIQSLSMLIFTSYERVGEEADYEVCLFHVNIASATLHAITYYGLFFVVVIIMLVLKWKIIQLERSNDTRVFNPTYLMAKMSLSLYPTALIVCWLPHALLTVTIFLFTSIENIYLMLYFIALQLKILHGFATALIFWYKSRETRRLWIRLYRWLVDYLSHGCQTSEAFSRSKSGNPNKNSRSFGSIKWSSTDGTGTNNGDNENPQESSDDPERQRQQLFNNIFDSNRSVDVRSNDYNTDDADMDFRDSLLPEGLLMIP